MRCLVTGAYGFIGSAVVAALRREGVSVVGAGRDLDLARRIHPDIEWIACDFNTDVDVAQWLPRLKDIDAVVNCVGILQGSLRDDARPHSCRRDHRPVPGLRRRRRQAAGACVRRERRGGRRRALMRRSKAKADAALETLDLSWLIVKPSLVIGQGSYGGTSLMRGLAGLPFVLPLPGEARERFQPIALDDLASGIAKLALTEAPSRTTLYAAGPETVSLREILVAYRAWLGFGPAREIVVPLPLLRVLLKLGDVAGWLGHVSSARTTSLVQLRYDTLVDGAAFAQASGIAPKSFSETLRASPATLQDRLHARSAFAVPLLHVALAAFWILTGILTLMPESFASATALVARAGLGAGFAKALVAAASITDILLGALFLLPGWVRRAGTAQLVLSAIYLVGLSLLAPSLWTDHFGPLLKVVPMMAATLVVMAFEEKR